MIFIIENTWTIDGEANDIINYTNNNKIECKILSVDELYEYDSINFIKNCVYFCNTDIVQYHLKKINKTNVIPNTYDEKFNNFYMRNIETMTVQEFDNKYKNIEKFIKPYNNNKEFDGRVITNMSDFELYGVKIPNLNTKIYCCDPIIFLSEVRLLIGSNKLYGHGHICKNKIDTYLSDKNLINQIITATNGEYYCIDIGLAKINNVFQWIIIEINPPFSLDDHEIQFNDYINFCIDACKFISSK